MNSKLGNKLAASVRNAKQASDAKEVTTKANTGDAIETKQEVKVTFASRRVWPD